MKDCLLPDEAVLIEKYTLAKILGEESKISSLMLHHRWNLKFRVLSCQQLHTKVKTQTINIQPATLTSLESQRLQLEKGLERKTTPVGKSLVGTMRQTYKPCMEGFTALQPLMVKQNQHYYFSTPVRHALSLALKFK